jgi:hypothetical protein
VIVGDFDLEGIAFTSNKTDSVLVVNANTVLHYIDKVWAIALVLYSLDPWPPQNSNLALR